MPASFTPLVRVARLDAARQGQSTGSIDRILMRPVDCPPSQANAIELVANAHRAVLFCRRFTDPRELRLHRPDPTIGEDTAQGHYVY